MTTTKRSTLPLLLLGITILFHSCLENPEITGIKSNEDEFSEANQIIENYIKSIDSNTSNGREEISKWIYSEKSITLLKYQESSDGESGELLFNTNRDEIDGFHPITEETITAYVKPGEFIFWYVAGGIKELAGIEFVPEAQEELGELPDDLDQTNLWFVWIPEQATSGELKYDILYRLNEEFNNSQDELIRLDPVVHVKSKEDEEEENDNEG